MPPATVIGIYGIPGCGKTHLLNRLRQELGQDLFSFHDGSHTIGTLVPGGIEAFKVLPVDEKAYWRDLAIRHIKAASLQDGRAAVVTGHYMFFSNEETPEAPIYTQGDIQCYTHILYLDVDPTQVAQQRSSDTLRSRPTLAVSVLAKWQILEKDELFQLCLKHGILFFTIPSYYHAQPDKISNLFLHLASRHKYTSQSYAVKRLEEAFDASYSVDGLQTVLLLDADKTICADDTGRLFWNLARRDEDLNAKEADLLKTIFSSPLGYTDAAFRQVASLYEQTFSDGAFDSICEKVASQVQIHDEFANLMRLTENVDTVAAVIVTCGLQRVWEKVLVREGFNKIVILGNGRLLDELTITAETKAGIALHLHQERGITTWAFGDSVLDLPMLEAAEHAIVVVGDEQTRSKTMEKALLDAIENRGLKASQALVPAEVSPRLDLDKLPLVQLTDESFINSITGLQHVSALSKVYHATNRETAKVLMTAMRDARVAGPVLRNVHQRVGWYLAVEYLPEVLGIEDVAVVHVQGHYTAGHRVKGEERATIVALMRGGEPMAYGVNEALDGAMFVHAKLTEDLRPHHLDDRDTVILVDSVVNSGKTIQEFVQRIRGMNPTIRVVIISGVVQQGAVEDGAFAEMLANDQNMDLITLRLSENKFVGKGGTDTGHRLFNTTMLD